MPYVSDRQRRFFNTPTGKAKLGPKVVNEFNQASKGKDLPEKAPDSPPMPKPKTRFTDMMKGPIIE